MYACIKLLIDPLFPQEHESFRREKSTADQIIFLTKSIKNESKTKEKAAAAALSKLTSAYDTFWHRDLTCKLLKILSDKNVLTDNHICHR